jgi:hypothetical protein
MSDEVERRAHQPDLAREERCLTEVVVAGSLLVTGSVVAPVAVHQINQTLDNVFRPAKEESPQSEVKKD